MKEIWKDINGYNGIYQVSNFGNVRSLDRIIFNKGSKKYCNTKGRILSTRKTNGNGYKVVSLHDKMSSKNHYTHRLVAEAFITNDTRTKINQTTVLKIWNGVMLNII